MKFCFLYRENFLQCNIGQFHIEKNHSLITKVATRPTNTRSRWGLRHDPGPMTTRPKSPPTQGRWWAYASLALSMSLVGSYVALSKPLVLVFPVFLLAWLRFGIGGLAMLRWLRKPADEPALSAHTRRLLFLESFLGNFLFSICMLFGVSLTTAVAAGVVMSSIPAVVAVLSRIFLKERIGRRTLAAIACCRNGNRTFFIAEGRHHGRNRTPWPAGPAIVDLGAICWYLQPWSVKRPMWSLESG